jgi:DNA-binding beta-propeller fold protein YncE
MVRAVRLVLLASAVAALAAGCGSDEKGGPRGETKRADRDLVVSATVHVVGEGHGEDPITAVAVGEDGVWVGGGGCSGSVSRVDPDTNKVVAAMPVGFVLDVAVGAGAVWAVGGVCSGGKTIGGAVFRIDPRQNEVTATIPLDLRRSGRSARLPYDLAAGEGAVWVPLSFSPTSGEVVRLDPHTNAVAARIPARGWTGELAVGGGAVWVLSHPEWTDETSVQGASLLRIDPSTDAVVATPMREELPEIGAAEVPPVIAAGDDAVWLRSTDDAYPNRASAVRIDARTNEVAREPLTVGHFWPFAVAEGGVWFIGSTGTRSTLARLNSQTLDIDQSVELGVAGVDAAFDPSSRSFWVADERSVVRVDLR